MISSARSVIPALLSLVLAATAGCGGPEGTVTADPEEAAAQAPAAAPARPATLPLSASGRTAVFSHGPRDAADKTVALTFDADMTADQGARAAGGERFDNPALVALLRAEKVPATFFVTGMWARTYPAQARSIGRDPLFEVGNHSYSHHAFTEPCYGLPALGQGRALAEVREGFAALRGAGIEDPLPYFRFPGGCYDDRALRAVAPAEVTAVQWDVAGGDPFNRDADDIVRQVLGQVRPGSVVVLHCTLSAAPATAEAVRRIVPELRERGYRFARVSELIADSLR
ncbi:polysaccharide deacetylase family protein [Streptomyces sp. TRM 70351]|uniref:polysaccharide deacetylase family protein n=1 Tax=Streptomyces sp. TRM 70351 TaxID=3116552 RepID=UPI002E7B46F6|nr:polysaccharide deacetylase family protein [Streptomyces sp. TRM 70351]MEE1926808.1 polysaccharide deacetylase family protein [Streptomyces sp. TRM 70351]